MVKQPHKPRGVSLTLPSKPVGRAIDAIVDIFRPFSEARGLKADQIRVQREEVAIEVAKRARERLSIEKTPIVAVPNKILVPLIEAASNEDIDDDYMINAWASLLAAAATDRGVEPRFVGILRELSANQARLLHRLASNNWANETAPVPFILCCPSHFEPVHFRQSVNVLLADLDRRFRPPYRQIQDEIAHSLSRPGGAVYAITQYKVTDGDVILV